MKEMQRIHLYGASNLWLSRRAALAGLRARFEGPLEVGLACGPGRSYGVKAGNPLVRYLALRSTELPPDPDLAILTDVGNDIAYGQNPGDVLGWIEELTTRLGRSRKTSLVITGTPLESLRLIPQWFFPLLRSVLYPSSTITQERVLKSLEEITAGVKVLAQQRGYQYLEPDARWYGLDHVHLDRAHYGPCWETWLEQIRPRQGPLGPWPGWWRTLGMVPAHCWVLGREQRCLGDYSDVLPGMKLIVR